MENCTTRLYVATTQLESYISHLEGLIQPQDANQTCARLREENARLLALLRAHPPPRPTMLPQRRLRLAAQQSWTCAKCSALLSAAFHADHKTPWTDTFDDTDSNIQILCAPCHLEKTSEETSTRNKGAPEKHS